MLKFKPGTKTLKISTTGSHEFSLEFGAEVPNAARMEETWSATQKVFDSSPKVTVQGSSTEGGGGSVRYCTLPAHGDSSQVVLWNRDIGKQTANARLKSSKVPIVSDNCMICIVVAPHNRIMPSFRLQDPAGRTIRIIATNYMEFPFEAVVTPYEQFQDSQGGFNAARPQSYD